MKQIKLFEEEIKKDKPSISWQVLRAYYDVIKTENKLLDFDGAIFESNIPDIVETLKIGGVNEFTISSNYSGLIGVIAEFEKYGVYLKKLTTINASYTDTRTNTLAKIPAIEMVIED